MHTFDPAANLALFLLDRTGSVCGKWQGRLGAKEQRELMGQYLGKGLIVINGEDETVKMIVKVCFGLDTDVRARATFRELCLGRDARAIYIRDGQLTR